MIVIPFLLQAIAILIDEVYFHVRRGLPKWERIGHPLDTLTVIACYAYILCMPYSPTTLIGYILLAIFSTIFITKDEFVHQKHCPGAELWLHAVLFILHPITLICAGLIWPVIQGVQVAPRFFLIGQLTCMTGFMLYQIVYWNYVRGDQ